MGRERILRDRVNRLRQLMQEAAPTQPATGHPPHSSPTDHADVCRSRQFPANDQPPAANDSEAAIAIQAIKRIATTYGRTRELQRYLDQHSASSLSALDPTELEALREHMDYVEDCANLGISPRESPAAS